MPFGYAPPPNVWWSKPLMPLPQPSLGVVDWKSSSVNTAPLHGNSSWLTNVRPVTESVKPIGSRLMTLLPLGGLTLTGVHVDVPRLSLNFTSYSCVYDVKNVWLVFQLLPIDGSPASVDTPFGASNCLYVGAFTPFAIGVAAGLITDARTS